MFNEAKKKEKLATKEDRERSLKIIKEIKQSLNK
jgi:hypothetical protein